MHTMGKRLLPNENPERCTMGAFGVFVGMRFSICSGNPRVSLMGWHVRTPLGIDGGSSFAIETRNPKGLLPVDLLRRFGTVPRWLYHHILS